MIFIVEGARYSAELRETTFGHRFLKKSATGVRVLRLPRKLAPDFFKYLKKNHHSPKSRCLCLVGYVACACMSICSNASKR
jgi:hypothetical protein